MISIPTNLKLFLILIATFGVIYWFQQVDDKRRCKEKLTIYDNIKLPLLATSIVGLILFWDTEKFLTLFISSNSSVESPIKPSNENMQQKLTDLLPNKIIPSKPSNVPDFDVYTSLAE